MSMVIRVADGVFTRLQRLAEPFVDTPSDVVERLLDEHDRQHTGTDRDSSLPRSEERRSSDVNPQLYLVPASKANARATLQKPVHFEVAASVLEKDQTDDLDEALGGRKPFRCWAMTENSRAYWEAMNPGDIVLFTLKGSGKFDYGARVLTKIESEALGQKLWSVVPSDPWSLIYVVKDVERISIDKARLVQGLGYSPNYVVPGTIRVDRSRVRVACERHGSLDRFIQSLAEV